jgi:mannose-6-phosphate isomerase-like protein (cupin superfamily)
MLTFYIISGMELHKKVAIHALSLDNVSPITTPHGELISELIGRTATEGSVPQHSVAHIVLPPGKSSLLHYHPEAEESYYILSGQARVLIGEEEVVLTAGTAVLIPSPQPHKITNIGSEDLAFLAICVPAWAPDNSVFLEDRDNVK